MEALAALIQKKRQELGITSNTVRSKSSSKTKTDKEIEKEQCEIYNSQPGSLGYIDCPKCKNRGGSYYPRYSKDFGYWSSVWRECSCMKLRREAERRERSGLSKQFVKYSFDNYKTYEPWQNHILSEAHAYVNNPANRWFFIGGQPGCGKTHICTAMVGALINKGFNARYMIWNVDTSEIKRDINNSEIYAQKVDYLKKAEVLYIDDFFKRGRSNVVSDADVSLTFEIINYRYNECKPTIISSELSLNEIAGIDEALGSRIIEMSKDKMIYIPPDVSKNIRLRM